MAVRPWLTVVVCGDLPTSKSYYDLPVQRVLCTIGPTLPTCMVSKVVATFDRYKEDGTR